MPPTENTKWRCGPGRLLIQALLKPGWKTPAHLVARLAREHQDAELALAALRTELAVRGESGLRDQLDTAQSSLVQVERAHERTERLAVAAQLLYESTGGKPGEGSAVVCGAVQVRDRAAGANCLRPDFSVAVDHRSLEIVNRTLEGRTVPFGSLSSWRTRAALCPGAAGLRGHHQPDGRRSGAPVIIDDALGYSDAGRLARLGAAFSAAARNCQVIILTCAPERYRGIGSAVVRKMERPARPAPGPVPDFVA